MGANESEQLPNLFLWLVALTICMIAVYDTWATTVGRPHLTISDLIFLWSSRWPALPFAIGFLCGHLFWRKD